MAAGLIHAVVEEGELEATVLAAADAVAQKPPEALRVTRDLIRGPREPLLDRIQQESELFRQRLKSNEARAAFMAFMNRRKAG